MAQSVWMAVPSKHQYRIVDVTGKPEARVPEGAELATAPNGEGAIIAAVALATSQQRRVTSICRFNMRIVLVVD
jgi:hypothetical protein